MLLSFRNAKFVDGLAKSRLRLMGDLENLLGTTGPLEETLEKLEEVRGSNDPQIYENVRNKKILKNFFFYSFLCCCYSSTTVDGAVFKRFL